MAGIPEQGFDPMASSQQNLDSDAFVSLNVGSLSLLAAAEKDSSASPKINRTLSRKGSQRVGEKAAEAEAEPARVSTGESHRLGGPEKEAFLLHVADEGEGCTVNHATTPTGKSKRIPSRRRSSSSWIDPRRVLIFFATLSSMGTLILLYFTISMSMTSSDADAR
ncbi:hypothetical protein J5N97_027241 [Dioscorea zingiberensis]|uniref:Transmembrane protein n=1 Tax=Dioscorea zingiberensis TaxID=325984 RepID=A0A9D5C4I1_9LILI|nr:hypothetical protein J5N97_027241 [Dioscorea zingiberensis]